MIICGMYFMHVSASVTFGCKYLLGIRPSTVSLNFFLLCRHLCHGIVLAISVAYILSYQVNKFVIHVLGDGGVQTRQ